VCFNSIIVRGWSWEELAMGLIFADDGWRIPDALWEKMRTLIPPGKPHPNKGHNPRIPDRDAMNGILFVLRTGCQWQALDATCICKHSAAHRRFLEWSDAGVFEEFWREGLLKYDEVKGVDWEWLSMDGAMTKAPLGGKNRPQSDGPRQKRREKKHTNRCDRYTFVCGG
jgi:transposase